MLLLSDLYGIESHGMQRMYRYYKSIQKGMIHLENKGGICHGFMTIDPKIFGDAEAIKNHMSRYLETLRNSPKADGQDRIYTHGEKEIAAVAHMMANGIPVNDNTMVEVYEMCQFLDSTLATISLSAAKASNLLKLSNKSVNPCENHFTGVLSA